ncbi:deoxyribodipyrimidine photo-lyase [Marivirga sp. S37H4]|uniref:Deoxyribodipyrimidine photo-lyase n=1 Tax=Marivirga aurantiaca TaxID=2802615 RepID=A0A935CCV8_9BACT|nr:deoxyribodipyrimidine photo-lyase [Marivirga aurantiaca]MBK6266338.1 deoxyribodipyrimidine photo-lyase [Marivirga aurantiaca]
MEKLNIFWFRRDLRLFDNTGLYYAQNEKKPVLPIFIFDTEILNDLVDKKDARVSFIHHTLKEIDLQLKKLGSGLLILHGKPEEVFEKLIKDYEIDTVFTNRDYEPYAKERDQKIDDLLKKNGIDFLDFKDHVIFEEKEILNGSEEPYKVFTPYKNKWLESLKNNQLQPFDVQLSVDKFYQFEPEFPDLESIGFEKSTIEIADKSYPEEIIKKYDKLRDYPAKNGTSRLGIHLRFGTISIRQAVKKAQALNDTWLNELIWREFYSMILGNFPHVMNAAFKSKYDAIPWRNEEEDFEKWCQGKTGYPIVDAGMRELNSTGYMHNRVRMITASFLTKHLLIDWRWGEAYFAEKLLDYELSSNNGGWQWAAGTGTDAQPYFRIFNPYSQTDKFDKENKYIKKWIPELNTKEYPEPMVDHKFARQRALDTYKQALDQ